MFNWPPHETPSPQEKRTKQPMLQTLLVLAAAGISSAASAQAVPKEPAFPTKPIRMVVPFTPGSATDIIARIIGPRLAETLGRSIVVDNRPSAGVKVD